MSETVNYRHTLTHVHVCKLVSAWTFYLNPATHGEVQVPKADSRQTEGRQRAGRR